MWGLNSMGHLTSPRVSKICQGQGALDNTWANSCACLFLCFLLFNYPKSYCSLYPVVSITWQKENVSIFSHTWKEFFLDQGLCHLYLEKHNAFLCIPDLMLLYYMWKGGILSFDVRKKSLEIIRTKKFPKLKSIKSA